MDKLFATIHTIRVSFTSALGMFLFITLSNGDVFIYHLATFWTKADWNVFAIVIIIGAIVSLCYHFSFLSI